jgi:TPR repeat protein
MTPTAIRKRLSRVRKSEHQKQVERETDTTRRQLSRARQDELDPVAAGLRRERDAEAHLIARAQQDELDPAAAADRRARDVQAHRIAALFARAGKGETRAMLKLETHFRSSGDIPQALHWLRRAAEAGDTFAQLDLGWRYRDGDGAQRDVIEALQWLRRASGISSEWKRVEFNDPWSRKWAQYSLGQCYRLGLGVEACSKTSVAWFSRAVDNNAEHLGEHHNNRVIHCDLAISG